MNRVGHRHLKPRMRARATVEDCRALALWMVGAPTRLWPLLKRKKRHFDAEATRTVSACHDRIRLSSLGLERLSRKFLRPGCFDRRVVLQSVSDGSVFLSRDRA